MSTPLPAIRIPWARPVIGDPEIKEVLSAFDADWLTQGPKVKAFEAKMARIMDVPHAVAISNGSDALDIALMMLGLRPGDEVIIPAITYYATASSVSRLGGIPVFVDIDQETLALDPSLIAKAVGPNTKGVMFIDHGGGPARIREIVDETKRLGLFCLQDAAQSLGGAHAGKPLGGQTPISTMSFHLAKIMTTVEGGMIFTHDEKFAREAQIYRNQGESEKYYHTHLGTNCRMTDMAAAIGLHQADRLPGLLAERARIAQRYDAKLVGKPGIERPQRQLQNNKHANFLYSVLVENRDAVALALRKKGIDTRVCYPLALYDQPVYKSGRAPYRTMKCPVSERTAQRIINLPVYPQMTDSVVDEVADALLAAVTS